MGNRTSDLPELTGLPHLIREVRYNEFARQLAGVVLVALYALWAAPRADFFWFGAVIAVAGILIRLYASGFVMKNKELATTGPYALVRHPLYTGNILLLLGFCFANGQVWVWPVFAFFLLFWYPITIDYEDNKLHGIFGESWEEWSARTPALIPRSLDLGDNSDTSWSFAKSLNQNLEPVIVVYCLFWLYWLGAKLPA